MSEDPIFKKEVVWTKVIPEIEGHINAVPDAKDALAALVKAGCNRKQLLRYLYMFLGGSPADARAVKKGFSRCRTQVSALVTRLKNAADEIERVEHNLRYTGLMEFSGGTLAEDMRRMAGFLSQMDTVIKDMASGRTSGREKHFVLLAYTVREVTRRPHYKEIGALADAVGVGYDPSFEPKYTAEVVEKFVSRHGWLNPKKRKPKSKGQRR
jgi:hypothetical protein